MESVDFFDRHLDPTDEPTHGPCDNCGDIFDNGDLTILHDRWLCETCAGEVIDREGDDDDRA